MALLQNQNHQIFMDHIMVNITEAFSKLLKLENLDFMLLQMTVHKYGYN